MSWSDFKREANFIGGEWQGADSGATIAVTNPATGEVIGSVPNAGRAETVRAIAAAERRSRVFPARRRMSGPSCCAACMPPSWTTSALWPSC